MKSEIKIPPMGESISEAVVGTILKESGSQVKIDDEVIEIETDKVNQVLYSPQAGTLTITVQPQQVVKIGDVIGYVEDSGQPPEQKEPPKQDEKPQEPAKQEAKPTAKEEKPQAAEQKPVEQASPPVENIRIQKEDAIKDLSKEKAPQETKPPVQPQPVKSAEEPVKGVRETRKPMSRIRKLIAERLVESQRTTAMLTTFNEADMSQIISLREKYKEDFTKHWNVKLGFMSFFVKATVSALKAFPDFNSYLDGEDIVHREYYDIGIAVGSDRGLVVPVVRNCDRLTFSEIESAIEGFAKQARSGGLSADHLKGGGFTITNGGVYGSLLSTPILNPPQCGILGLHKIEKRPIAVNDQVVIKPMMYLALSYDHRIVDGKEAVSFLVHIKNIIEDPSRLLLDV